MGSIVELNSGYTKQGKSWVSITRMYPDMDTMELEDIRYYFKQIINNFDYIYLLFHHEAIGIDMFSQKKYIKLINIINEFNIEDRFFVIDCDLNNNSEKSLFIKNYINGFIPRDIFKKKKVSIKKHFVCHNNQKKIHRDYIVSFIRNNNIDDKVFLSYHQGGSSHNINKASYLTHEYYSSFCNIVTETYFEKSTDEIFTFSEKLFKPIVSEIPFILAAQYKSLEKLHEIGFKTFDKWWDESYDLEIDSNIRLEKICNVILEISTWNLDKCIQVYNEMKSVLHHNSELYKKLQKEWDWLYDTEKISLIKIT